MEDTWASWRSSGTRALVAETLELHRTLRRTSKEADSHAAAAAARHREIVTEAEFHPGKVGWGGL